MLEKVVAAWQPVHDRSDVVVVEGLSPGAARLYASGLNQALAKTIDADVPLVASWPAAAAGSSEDRADLAAEPGLGPAAGAVKRLAESLAITASGYWSDEHARVVGCVVNGVPARDPSAAAQLGEALAQGGLRLIAAVPHRPELTWLRVHDLVRELDPQVLNEGDQSRRINEVAVFAQDVPAGLRVLTEGRLVMVPGDRHDVIIAACLAAVNGTRLAALLLTAGAEPDPRVAMISFSTGTSGTGSDVDKVAEATRIVREREPDLAVDGPLQYDAAAIGSVGHRLHPGPYRSPVTRRITSGRRDVRRLGMRPAKRIAHGKCCWSIASPSPLKLPSKGMAERW